MAILLCFLAAIFITSIIFIANGCGVSVKERHNNTINKYWAETQTIILGEYAKMTAELNRRAELVQTEEDMDKIKNLYQTARMWRNDLMSTIDKKSKMNGGTSSVEYEKYELVMPESLDSSILNTLKEIKRNTEYSSNAPYNIYKK